MALHKDLTGADLHEPKGITSATLGQVYVADGAGSGAWTSKNGDILNANTYSLNGTIDDLGTAGSSCFFYVQQKSQMTKLAAVTYAALTGANAVLTIYINGVLFADSLTVPFTGSSTGGNAFTSIVTANTITAGSVIEVRSDGGPSNAVKGTVSLLLSNVV
jgi:hypothetical protein